MAEEFINNQTGTVSVDKKGKALTSFILGLISLITWLVPFLGLPTTIVGLVMGILGLKSSRKWMAIVGVILCILCLVATIINSVVGAIRGAQGI